MCVVLFGDSSRGGTRTPDPVINSHLLYQLSYSGRMKTDARLMLARWLGEKYRRHNVVATGPCTPWEAVAFDLWGVASW